MPKYPTNFNDPSLSVDNVGPHREFRNSNVTAAQAAANPGQYPSDYPLGALNLSGSTDTVGDLIAVLAQLSTEISIFNTSIEPPVQANTAQTITVYVNGTGTSWTSVAPVFTLSGGTGASIVSQSTKVVSDTLASLQIVTGSATGALTITETGSKATFVVTVAAASNTATPSTILKSGINQLIAFQGTGTAWDATTVFSLSALSTPTGVSASNSGTGGTLTAATYYYRVSATNGVGETLASTEVSTVVASGTTNKATISWTAVSGATGYKVYGRTTGAELLIGTISSGATVTFDDTGSVTPAGALPVANTTASGAAIVSQSINPNTQQALVYVNAPAAAGTLTFSNSTDSVKTIVTIVNAILVPSSSSFTSSERSYLANMEAIKIAYFQRNALQMAYFLKRLSQYVADAATAGNTTGALGAPSASKYPSAQNRGY